MFPPRLFRQAKRLARNARGVSAIEFALIAPFLLLVYLGTVELSLMLMADRKVTATASSLGDLIARDTTVDNCDVADVFAAANILFQPNASADARMRVASIRNTGGVYSVDWSEAKGPLDDMGQPTVSPLTTAEAQALTIDANLIPDGGTVIFAEVSYTHRGLFQNFMKVDVNGELQDQFFIRPRRTDSVTRDTTAMTCP